MTQSSMKQQYLLLLLRTMCMGRYMHASVVLMLSGRGRVVVCLCLRRSIPAVRVVAASQSQPSQSRAVSRGHRATDLCLLERQYAHAQLPLEMTFTVYLDSYSLQTHLCPSRLSSRLALESVTARVAWTVTYSQRGTLARSGRRPCTAVPAGAQAVAARA